MSIEPDSEGIRGQIAATIHSHWKLVLTQGIVMMALGFLAVVEPNVATLAVSIFVGWLFFIGGIFRALSVWRSRAMPGFAWSLLTALLAIVFGLILIFRPLAGALTLTMILVAFFILEGITARNPSTTMTTPCASTSFQWPWIVAAIWRRMPSISRSMLIASARG